LYALENGKGDCTEFSYLLAALARARGIPARVVAGFVTPKSAVLKRQDYHAWTEMYLGGTWRIMDAERGLFMAKESEYVALRILDGAGDPWGGNTPGFF